MVIFHCFLYVYQRVPLKCFTIQQTGDGSSTTSAKRARGTKNTPFTAWVWQVIWPAPGQQCWRELMGPSHQTVLSQCWRKNNINLYLERYDHWHKFFSISISLYTIQWTHKPMKPQVPNSKDPHPFGHFRHHGLAQVWPLNLTASATV